MMANCFVQSFSNVFNTEVLNHPFPHQTCNHHHHLEPLHVTCEMIEIAIGTVNLNSAMGEDGIHPRLLHALKNSLSIPLSFIFNSSLHSEVLPLQWLSSIIVPIYKKSHRYDPLNYRAVVPNRWVATPNGVATPMPWGR